MKKTLLLLVAFFQLLLLKSYAQSDTTAKDNLSLKDLLNIKVVTATRVSQGLEMAPATVIVVTKDQIRSRGYQSLLDVMYDLPDVKVDDKIYSGIRNSFTVRGIQGSEKFVILLDGVNISSPSGEAMPIMENYPVNIAEQIEVVYGPSSALYGANAVSGVINIITKKTSKKDTGLDVSTAAGTYGYTNSTLFFTKELGDDSRLIVSGQYAYDQGVDYSKLYRNDSQLNIDAYASGTLPTIYGPFMPAKKITPRYEAPMHSWNIYASLHLHDFNFSLFRNSFAVPTAFGNNTGNAIYNKDVSMLQDITVGSASYKKTINKFTSTGTFTASQYNLDPKSNYRNLYTSGDAAYKYSTNTMIRAEEQLSYDWSKHANVIAGISYENYYAIPQSGDLASPVDKDEYLEGSYLGTSAFYKPEGLAAQFYFVKYHNVGSYLQAQCSPNKKIHFTLGARYDNNSRYGSTFNPRLGMVYNSSSATTIKILYGKAYIAPAPSDAYAQWGTFITTDSGRTYTSPFLHLPNPGLSPITSSNLELNINQKLTDNFFLNADIYYTSMVGLHEFSDDNATTKLYNNTFNGIPVDYIEVFTNNNRQKNYGGSIMLNWKYSLNKLRFTSYATLSYVYGRIEQSLNEKNETLPDEELDFISPFMFRFGVDGKYEKFTFSPRLIVMGRQHIAGIADSTTAVYKRQTLPGYALLNVSLRYATSRKTSVFLNISNALNQRYRAVGFNMDLKKTDTELMYGQPQDPIRFTGGININF